MMKQKKEMMSANANQSSTSHQIPSRRVDGAQMAKDSEEQMKALLKNFDNEDLGQELN